MSSYLELLLNKPTCAAAERIERMKKKAEERRKVKETKDWEDKNGKKVEIR
jgi:hypothetical protein